MGDPTTAAAAATAAVAAGADYRALWLKRRFTKKMRVVALGRQTATPLP